MVLAYWWVSLFGAVGLGTAWVLYKKGKLGHILSHAKTIRVAHSHRITDLPEYQRVKGRYRRWMIVLIVFLSVALVTALVLAGRPSAQSLVTPAEKNRDIMLCLDVSGSMASVDTKIVETFESLARNFKGQRLGLDIFNVNVSQVFPLTDDYSLIDEQLAYAKKILSSDRETLLNTSSADYYSFYSGTDSSGMKLSTVSNGEFPASNAGLGLAGCVRHLGDNPSGRSQSVLLATDNELYGDPSKGIITTSQAMMLAKQKGVRVYALDPGVFDENTLAVDASKADNYAGDHAVLKNYAIVTAGNYYRLSSVDVVPDIISQISKQEAKLFVGDSQYAASDMPLFGFIVLCVAFGALVWLTWRLEL